MLVLTRKLHETLVIDRDIRITVVEIPRVSPQTPRVHLGIEHPKWCIVTKAEFTNSGSEYSVAGKLISARSQLVIEALKGKLKEAIGQGVLTPTAVDLIAKALAEVLNDHAPSEEPVKADTPVIRPEGKVASPRPAPVAPPVSELPRLCRELDHKDGATRKSAAKSIRAMGVSAKNAGPALIGSLNSNDADVRYCISDALVCIGASDQPTRVALTEALAHDHLSLRVYSAAVLLEILRVTKGNVSDLMRRLQLVFTDGISSDDEDVCRIAVESLDSAAVKPDPSTVPALIAILKRRCYNVDYLKTDMHRSATRLLGRLGPAAKAAVPALIELLRRGSDKQQIQVVYTLGAIGPDAREAIPALLEVISENDIVPHEFGLWEKSEAPHEAAEALLKIRPDPRVVVPKLIELLQHKDPEIQVIARELLDKIDPRKRAQITAYLGLPKIKVVDSGKSTRKRKTDPLNAEKSLLALLRVCLEWPKDLISRRGLAASKMLKVKRAELGLPALVDDGTIGNHLTVLAKLCDMPRLVTPHRSRKGSHFLPGARDRLLQILPLLEEKIRAFEARDENA